MKKHKHLHKQAFELSESNTNFVSPLSSLMFQKRRFLMTVDAAATKLSKSETMRRFKPTAHLNKWTVL